MPCWFAYLTSLGVHLLQTKSCCKANYTKISHCTVMCRQNVCHIENTFKVSLIPWRYKHRFLLLDCLPYSALRCQCIAINDATCSALLSLGGGVSPHCPPLCPYVQCHVLNVLFDDPSFHYLFHKVQFWIIWRRRRTYA